MRGKGLLGQHLALHVSQAEADFQCAAWGCLCILGPVAREHLKTLNWV